ncbi:MAG: winged helix-turn-helix transcriptional regulator [Patescibacteria group bacterium]
MIQNLEFIKNRSFEIAWAVFRCAVLVKQDNLKKNLEDGAINLVHKYGHSDLKSDVVKNVFEIEKLISLIRLAEAIGEIKIVNARVLYRELSNLHNAVKKHEELLVKQASQNPEEAVFIESIFSQPPMAMGEFVDVVRQPALEIRQNQDSNLAKKSKENNSSAKLTTSSSAIVMSGTRQSSSQVVRQNQSSAIAELNNSAVSIGRQAIIRQETAQTDEESVQDSWQNLIYRKIKEFGKVSTKEIAAFFPEISERTIRFYLQKLNDSGLIEKTGTSGPGSFYTLKK